MTQIALDTNIWIYLTKDSFYELWLKLKQMKENGEVEIIINDIIIQEWNRNKETTTKSLIQSIKNEYNSAINLSNYLHEKEKETFLNSISQYKDEKNRITKAENRVSEIENFMNTCTIIKTSDKQKLFISELAIQKKHPFQNNKNNFNDALILRNICEFAQNQIPKKYDLIYVSNNPDDFTDKTTGDIYPDLFKGLGPIRLKSVTQLGEALNLAPELIDDIDDWIDYHVEMSALIEWEISRGK